MRMNLKIERLCDATLMLTGRLNEALPVSVNAAQNKVEVRIATWTHHVNADGLQGIDRAKYAVHAALAAYALQRGEHLSPKPPQPDNTETLMEPA